jgi:glycerol-3-phosphate cytidylyltransferase
MKVGLTASTFDLLHAGHIAMLREAKTQCDYLICALQIDPSIDRPEKNKPVQTIVERFIQLQAVKYVDEIVPYQTEEDLEDILKTYQLDVRIIGEEYKSGKFTGRAICASRGIEIYFNKRDHRFSTSDLRLRVTTAANKKGYDLSDYSET